MQVYAIIQDKGDDAIRNIRTANPAWLFERARVIGISNRRERSLTAPYLFTRANEYRNDLRASPRMQISITSDRYGNSRMPKLITIRNDEVD